MSGKPKDITGCRSGKLVAIEPTSEKRHNGIVWKCLCDCGNYTFLTTNSFRKTRSCGCGLSQSTITRLKNNTDGFVTKHKLSHSKNILNGKLSVKNTSGCTGVCLEKRTGHYTAEIMVNRKKFRLGTFRCYEDAVKARKSAEWMLEERIENLEEELSKLKEGDSK